MTVAQPAYISPEEYLEGEKTSPIRHEYIDGTVYAMAGGTDNHNQIAVNLCTMLRSHVRGGPCRVYMADIKVRIETLNLFYYPDLMVTCSDSDHESHLVKRNPCVVVEVLSEGTEAFDRGRKFSHYRTLDSLLEYVLIAQNEKRVDHFRRDRDGRWVLTSWTDGDQLRLDSVGFECPIESLYEDVEIPALVEAAENWTTGDQTASTHAAA